MKQSRDQEHLLKQPDITLPRLVADVDASAELRIVDQLAGVLGQQPHEFRKLGQLLDVSDIPQIARQDRREIRPRPVLPPALAVATDRFGEAAEQDKLGKVVAQDCLPLASKLSCEEMLQESRRPAFDLRPCERQHLDGFHPPGQAVCDPRQGQDICRAGEQEAARSVVFVDRLLDGE